MYFVSPALPRRFKVVPYLDPEKFLAELWWRHQMETFPAQRPVTRSFDIFFDLHLNKSISESNKQLQFGN